MQEWVSSGGVWDAAARPGTSQDAISLLPGESWSHWLGTRYCLRRRNFYFLLNHLFFPSLSLSFSLSNTPLRPCPRPRQPFCSLLLTSPHLTSPHPTLAHTSLWRLYVCWCRCCVITMFPFPSRAPSVNNPKIKIIIQYQQAAHVTQLFFFLLFFLSWCEQCDYKYCANKRHNEYWWGLYITTH